MARAVVRGGFDAWVGAGAPAKSNSGTKFLRLLKDTAYAYIYLKNPAPRGSTILSATLRVHAHGASTGTRTLTARRVADSWKAKRINWNNKPGVMGSSRPTATIGAVANGDVIEFDVTQHLQNVTNGSAHYGWRIETDATTGHRLFALNAAAFKPRLIVEWSEEPAAPTDLVPSGGAVSVDKPVLQFSYGDLTGDDMVALRVQVDPAANGSSPAFDTGERAATEPELALADTAYPGLAVGATTQWRVRVKDAGGLWSDWSDWATFRRVAKGMVNIVNPGEPPNDFVNEPTPPIVWTFSGTQTGYRVRVTDQADRSVLRYDSGRITSTETAHTIPEKWNGRRVLVDDREYAVNVRVFDNVDRVATPGDPVHASTWRAFTMDDDLTVPAPTLTAEQEGATPWVRLTFTRNTAPDYWVVWRDGKVLQGSIEPEDVFVSGNTYAWRDWTASPQEPHTYRVKAVVNGKQSGASNAVTLTTAPVGIWLIDFERDTPLSACILGDDPGTWAMPDQASVYTPIGAETAVRIVTGMRGLEGSISGVLIDALGRTAKQQEANLLKMKERPARVYQLIVGDISIPVVIGDLTIAPTPDSRKGDVVKQVSFSFWQAGDLPFEARL